MAALPPSCSHLWKSTQKHYTNTRSHARCEKHLLSLVLNHLNHQLAWENDTNLHCLFEIPARSELQYWSVFLLGNCVDTGHSRLKRLSVTTDLTDTPSSANLWQDGFTGENTKQLRVKLIDCKAYDEQNSLLPYNNGQKTTVLLIQSVCNWHFQLWN